MKRRSPRIRLSTLLLLILASAPSAQGQRVRDQVFDLGDNPVLGASTARLTLVEFSDFQCGYCAKHERDTYPQIAREYIDTGRLRYAALDLPLSRHALAFRAAEAAHCAGDQGRYWEMRRRLFDHQRDLEPWTGHAAALELDVAAFQACMEEGRHKTAIERDKQQARKAGVTGTPCFLLAVVEDPANPSRVTGLGLYRTALSFSTFKILLDEALSGLGE